MDQKRQFIHMYIRRAVLNGSNPTKILQIEAIFGQFKN